MSASVGGGKGAKKYGRGKRCPCMKAYTATNRCSRNKARKLARHLKQSKFNAGCAARGTARALRRVELQRAV
jgi:hypothetical protein